jgi:hypothetical protein
MDPDQQGDNTASIPGKKATICRIKEKDLTDLFNLPLIFLCIIDTTIL